MLRVVVQTLKILTIAVTAVLVAAGGQRFLSYAIDRSVSDDAGRPVPFTVTEDDTADTLAARLHDDGLIRSEAVFKGYFRFTNGELIPADYTLRQGMTVEQIVTEITGDAPAAGTEQATTFEITVPEGWRIEQIAEEAEAKGLEGGFEAFMEAANSIDVSQYEFLQSRPEGASLEGYLFPNTYDFYTTASEDNIRRMLDTFDANFTASMRQRTQEMGLSIHETLTIASLVEREAQVAEERPIIADIYLDRWQQGWELEADPTVQYVVGTRGNWWPNPLTEEQLFTDSPFNTYQTAGLPPGPICNPSLDSIAAVLTPAETDYMFFVAKNDGSGEHAFAVTKEEQDANVALYQGGGEEPGEAP